MNPKSSRRGILGILAAAMLATACGDDVADEVYDADAPPPPPTPGLEAAATSGTSVPGAAGAPDVPGAPTVPLAEDAPVAPLDTTRVQ